MNWLEILTLIEQLLGVAQKVTPIIEATHPLGAAATADIQAGLNVASAAVQALKPA